MKREVERNRKSQSAAQNASTSIMPATVSNPQIPECSLVDLAPDEEFMPNEASATKNWTCELQARIYDHFMEKNTDLEKGAEMREF